MFRIAQRTASLMMAGSVALLIAAPAQSATRPDQPIQGWSAMDGVAAGALLKQARRMPTSDMALVDQPYCAENAEIHATLKQDFNESRVDASQHEGAELWGSDQMGTWTLVAPREDATSCIIASGIGFTSARDVELYYRTAGLR